jgi:ABC transporter substrate binding protein
VLPLIGYLGPESPRPFASRLAAFRDGLAEMGYVEGRNVAIEFRWAEGQYERLPALAAELVNRQVAVIVAPGGAPVALAAKSATATIPIVFEMGGDPIALGVVGSLNRPEGNLTGVSSLNVEVGPKRLELLHEVVPTAVTVAIVVNPTSPTATSQLKNLKAAADGLGLQLSCSACQYRTALRRRVHDAASIAGGRTRIHLRSLFRQPQSAAGGARCSFVEHSGPAFALAWQNPFGERSWPESAWRRTFSAR